MNLKSSQIDFIINDLKKSGLIYQPLQEEITDHICSLVEEKIKRGLRFADAYQEALLLFGSAREMEYLQQQTINNNIKNPKGMLKNYFKIAVRNIKKQKFYSFINITGLSIGLACTILITLFIVNELSYDRHHEKGDRVFRVINHIKFGGNDSWYAVSPAPISKAMVEEIPEIEYSARFRSWGTFLVKKEKDNIKEYNVIWADPDVFNIFTIPLLKGDKNSVLREPNTMVISESIARKYFGEEDPVNQLLILNNDMNFKITGVFSDMPKNSHFHFNMMLAMDGMSESKNDAWLSNNFQTYFSIQKDADPNVTERKLNEMFLKHAGPQVMQYLAKTISELEKEGTKVEQFIQPLNKIHLHSNALAEFEPNGDIKYVYILSAVGLFILMLAIVNFTNLATARSADRAKEVGIRKVMGSFRSYLINQFLTESILISFISMIFAVIIANALIPVFNSLAGKSLVFPNFNPFFWITCLIVGLLIGILSGAYPAFFLSSFKPIKVLSGKLSKGSRSGMIRSTLVVFQFTISIVLIIGTIGVYNQLNFIQHKKLGYNKNQVISINDAYLLGSQAESYKNEILKNTTIISGTISGSLPVSNSNRNNNTFWVKGTRSAEKSVNMQSWQIDYDYIKTLGMKIVSGRDFSREFPSDSSGIILNQRAAKLYGFDNPIGQEIQTLGYEPDNSLNVENVITYRIIGVVEDFNWESLHENIGSVCLRLGNDQGKISFRYSSENTTGVIHTLETKWKEFTGGQAFEYTFLDEDFGNMYASEKQIGKIFTAFAFIAIIIACLGLFALAAFTAEQRTKEIGVRKVMGATAGNIVLLLSKDFTKLVIIAFLISIPLAWYGIKIWLESFAYKDIPGLFLFLGAGIGALLLAWITVSYQSLRAASTNPADALRDE